jgi:hypothetical protein
MQIYIIILLLLPPIFILFSNRVSGTKKILWVISSIFFNYFALLAFLLCNMRPNVKV